MNQPSVRLNGKRRAAAEKGVKDACEKRRWDLWAVNARTNARTNHVQAVVTTNCDSQKVLAALKAYATKAMRETGCWQSEQSPWSFRGSRRRLWTQKELYAAIDYVVYDQGPPLPEDD